MLRKLTVAAGCLLLLTTGAFAQDRDVPDICAGNICIISTDKLDAASQELAKLFASLEQSGELSADGATKLSELILSLEVKLAGGLHGASHQSVIANASGLSKVCQSDTHAFTYGMGSAFGSGENAIALMLKSEGGGSFAPQIITDELVVKLKEIQENGAAHGELAIELELLMENHANNFAEEHGAFIIDLTSPGTAKQLEFFVTTDIHLEEGNHGAHQAYKVFEAHGTHDAHPAHKIMKHLAPSVVHGETSLGGHMEGIDGWFTEWDSIMEELASDLSANQLDKIQNQLDLAKEHLNNMGGMHKANGLGMMFGPHNPLVMEGMVPGGPHGFEILGSSEELEGLPGHRVAHEGCFTIPGLPHGNELKMIQIGEEGELPFDMDWLMVEIEKLVQELVEQKLSE